MELPDFNKLWDYSKPAESERRFRELLPAAEASGDRSYHLQLITQIARAQGLQGNFNGAHATLDAVRDRLTDGEALARVRYLLERGRVFNSSDRATEAMPLFDEAWQIGRQAGEVRYAIDALHMLAIAAATAVERVRWNKECLRQIEANPGQEGWLPAVYNNLGEAYRALGRYAASLECFQKVLAIDRAAGREPWLYNRIDEARLLRLVGRVREALERMRAIAAEVEKEGRADGFVEEELGECLLATGSADGARGHSVKAWELLQREDWLKKQEPQRWARLQELASGQSFKPT